MKKPNLERIAGGGDGAARAILIRTPSPVTQSHINTLDGRDASALGSFGMRAASMALRQRSLLTLTDALFATVLSAAKEQGDVRDLMVALAVHFDPRTCAKCTKPTPARSGSLIPPQPASRYQKATVPSATV